MANVFNVKDAAEKSTFFPPVYLVLKKLSNGTIKLYQVNTTILPTYQEYSTATSLSVTICQHVPVCLD